MSSETVRRMRIKLYNLVDDPQTSASVSDDADDCETLEQIAEMAETSAYYAQIHANKARGFARTCWKMARESRTDS